MIVPVLGTVLVVFAIVLASFLGLVIGPTFQGEAMQKGGLGISIHNHAEFWIKALDESIQIISRRSAYDLGKSGGIIGPEIFTWSIGYPPMETLQKNLESQIEESLPQGTIKAARIIEWGSGFIDALDCGPIESSECFFVKGNKSLSISDKAIEAKISLKPHKFYFKIDSNYFRLLNVGIAIVGEARFNVPLFEGRLGDLLNEINAAKNPLSPSYDPRFKNLDVGINVLGSGSSSDSSLVGYWKFNEGLGNIANDYSGNGNNGIINGATWTTGKYGKALQFDGISNYVEIPDNPSLRASNNQITVEMWIKRNKVPTNVQCLISKIGDGPDSVAADFNVTYYISVPSLVTFSPLTEHNSQFHYGIAYGSYQFHEPVNFGLINDYNWHHIAATYDGNILKSYLDGNLVESRATLTKKMPLNDQPVIIGANKAYGPGDFFNGTIDEVKIYNRALSEDEIKGEYSSAREKNIVEITISDKTCLLSNDNYCIAPLKPGEPGIINPMDGKLIPYDFLKLKFRVDVENPIAPPICTRRNPTVTITPSTQTGPPGSSLIYSVSVKNNDNPSCGSSIFILSNTVCPSELNCVLNKNSLTISPGLTDSTTITVSSILSAPFGTYTFKVKATNFGEISYWKEDSADYVIPPECVVHTECAQKCDDLGIDFKWHGRNCASEICSIYEIWRGTCPEGDEGCMTGQCCIGQCQSNKCVCSHTNYVDLYGSRCPSGQSCGADCYCHPAPACTADLVPTVTGTGPCTVTLSMTTSGCDRRIWEIRNATSQVCVGIVSNPVSCPTQTVPLGSYNYNLYINGVLKDSEVVNCVAPSCTADLTTSVFDPRTGICTIGASFVPAYCDDQTWEIRDTNNNVKCSGTLPDTNCPVQWSFSGTNYTYLYIGGVLKGTKTDTCSAAPLCSAVFSAIISGIGPVVDTCEVSAGFIPTNCDNKPWQIKDSTTGAVVCDKTLPASTCQWIVFSGATGTTYTYDLYIDGAFKGTSSVRCNPTPECAVDSDCSDGSRCTDDKCNPLTKKCEHTPKPAGTVFATKSGYCPAYCSAGTKYTPTTLKSCDRKCDGVSANEPDCDYTAGCTASDYSSQSCGITTRTCPNYCSAGTKYTSTGNQQCNNGCVADGINCDVCTPPACSYTSESCGTSSEVCPHKCEGGIEYMDGHHCNLGCAADGINCGSGCTASSCGSADYDTKKTCHSGCNGDRCTWVYFCNDASGSNNEFQCLDCCDWGGCSAPYNCGCSVSAQIITEFQSNPSCYYFWDCCTGWAGPICTSCGWCPVTVTASCGYNDACTYGKFCEKQTTSYSDYCQCCVIGCNTYWGTNECTINTQCAYSGSEPTCTYYTDYVCDCFGAIGFNFRWQSPATFTATCS